MSAYGAVGVGLLVGLCVCLLCCVCGRPSNSYIFVLASGKHVLQACKHVLQACKRVLVTAASLDKLGGRQGPWLRGWALPGEVTGGSGT